MPDNLRPDRRGAVSAYYACIRSYDLTPLYESRQSASDCCPLNTLLSIATARHANGLGYSPRPFACHLSQNDLARRLGHVAWHATPPQETFIFFSHILNDRNCGRSCSLRSSACRIDHSWGRPCRVERSGSPPPPEDRISTPCLRPQENQS